MSAACRVCGCTDDDACDGGCWWHEPGLCSACVPVDPCDCEECMAGGSVYEWTPNVETITVVGGVL